jgi:hypothetical protein
MSSSSTGANLKKLMQQKQQSARLTHPQANYDSKGQLSCKICGTTIKHASLFAPHLISKVSEPLEYLSLSLSLSLSLPRG